MKKTLLLLFCFSLTSCVWAQTRPSVAKPRLYVLTIGVKDYKNSGLNLNFADKDAKEVATLFRNQTKLYDVRKVKTLVNKSATRDSIRHAFADMKNRISPSDLFVLFFSGHGIEDALIPYDYDEQDPERTIISRNYLTEKLEEMGCNSLILLDACHSGSFAKGKDVITSAQRQISADDAIRGLVESFSSTDKMHLILGSSASNKDSYECHECQNGYFAQGLIDAFDNLAFTDADGYAVKPDANNNGWLSPSEFSTYLQDAIKFRTAQASITDPIVQKQTVYKQEQTTADAPFIFVGGNIPPPPPKDTDRDGDGIPDTEDNCPTLYGTRANKGCPAEAQGSDDFDGDGFADNIDSCPDESGTANGCPDADRDGVPDKSDKCKNTAGKPEYEGCPDSDSDGIPDHKDNCPNEKGSKTYAGCPPPKPKDSDDDGFADTNDACPNDYCTTNNGCPIKNTNANFTENHDGLGLDMVFVKGGTFQMGDDNGEAYEKPAHFVTISDFYIGKTEITVAQFKTFVDDSNYKTDAEKEGFSWKYTDKWEKMENINWRHDCQGNIRLSSDYLHPVIHVSWNDAVAFCKWLNNKKKAKYRLPTEAEWEYAAGNGEKHTKYSWGSQNPIGKNGGNVADESKNPINGSGWSSKFDGFNDGYWFTAPVAQYNSNDFGLHDMTGNVWEWCSDWYKGYSGSSGVSDYTGTSRVLRGGSWGSNPLDCRVANRGNNTPEYHSSNFGFRLSLSVQ